AVNKYSPRRGLEISFHKPAAGFGEPALGNALTMNSTNPMPPDTRIFSPLAVARLCDTIGRYWCLVKRLTAVSAGRFYRFEHIVGYSFGKVVAKSEKPFAPKTSQPNPE